MAQFPNIFNCDLHSGPVSASIRQMYLGDIAANRVGVRVTDNGEAVALSGTCSGTAMLYNGGTVALTGVVDGNVAYVDLPAAVYSVEGPLKIFVTLTHGGSTTTLLEMRSNVTRTESGVVIDPGTIIPSVAALISDIEDAVASIPEDYSELSADVVQLKSDMAEVKPEVETLGEDVADLRGAISVLEPTATATDVGKALKVKTVADGKVSEYEFGDAAVIDPTLTQEGAAADAKVAGDDIRGLKSNIEQINGVAYSAGEPLKDGRSLNGYMLNGSGYLASGNDYNVSFYRVVPNETIYLKLEKDADTVYNFQSTDTNPSSSSGNIIENVHSAIDGFVTVPDGANYIVVCKLKTNTTNAICSTTSSQTGIMQEVNNLFDVREIAYASADLTTSNYVGGGAYDNKLSFSYIPVTDAGLLKVTWRDNRSYNSNTISLTFVVCKYLGSSYQIVSTFSALSVAGRTNVHQSNCYVDGKDTYYVGFYGIHPSNMSFYSYGWFLSSATFSSKDDLTVGTEFTKGSDYPTQQSIAFYPSVISTNYEMRKSIAEINEEISGNMAKEDEKYAHFSIDDCLFWTNLIDNEATYNSAFEEPHLALYKSIHDLYGFCITLNVFCTSGNYSISDVPSKFAAEFKANSNWLKFAYHAEDETTYLSNLTTAEATESYNKFASAIYAMTGTTDCIDRVTRLGFYDGNLDNCLAIRDANCGIVGLLCADDNRNSYYLNETLSAYVRNHAMYRDGTNQLVFITTVRRLEYYTVTDAAELLTVAKGNVNRYVEFFTHESSSDRLSAMVAWCVSNGYKFGFMQEVLRI